MSTQKLIDASFITKHGLLEKVSNVISKDDCWQLGTEDRWVLSHKAVQTLGTLAGISKNYEVIESPTIQPTYKNDLEHIVRVKIICNAKKEDGSEGCVHSDEAYHIATGEANRVNTTFRGRGFLRKMAEKRAYDVAVIDHIGLYSTVYSEDESQNLNHREENKEKTSALFDTDIEHMHEEINMLSMSKTKADLLVAAQTIRQRRQSGKTYSQRQLDFLLGLHERKLTQLEN